MKTIVLHIGIPKTGSSALQVFLARNRDGLLASSVDYLKVGEFGMGVAGKISSGNGAFLARCLLPAGAQARIADTTTHMNAIWSAIAGSPAETGVISSEMFVDADAEAMRGFLETLRQRGITPKVFYFVRAQDQFLMSSYIQQVKRHHYTGAPDEFALRAMKVIPHIRYHSHYRKMVTLFGLEHVTVRTFEGTLGRAGGLFHTMLDVLAVGADALELDIADVNTGLSGRDLAIMRALNRFRPRMQFSDFVVENAQTMGASRSGEVHALLTAEALAAVNTYFEAENRLLAQAYFHRDALFATEGPATAAAHPLSINDLGPADLIEFFGGLIVKMEQRIAILERRTGEPQTTTKPRP